MVNEKKVWIFDKEEHLLGTSKQLTAVISDWDSETQQMIEKLHRARDEQVRLGVKMSLHSYCLQRNLFLCGRTYCNCTGCAE